MTARRKRSRDADRGGSRRSPADLPAARPRAARRVSPGPAMRAATLALLAAATITAFSGVARNGFILLDDPIYVTEDPHVSRGVTLEGVRWFLTHPHGQNWHPLTSWSHMLDVQLFGLAPAGHHVVSLALHTLNALLLLVVLARLTGAWWRSALVAAFFALHPLRVESVAWTAERKDVLSALFFLLTLEAYRRWVARPGRGRYALLVGVYALGLMSKPMLVTLPCVLVLIDVWPLGRRAGGGGGPGTAPGAAGARSLAGLVREKAPLLALAAASAAVTFVVQRMTHAVASMGLVPPGRRVTNALLSFWRYIGETLWPAGLAPFYPFGTGSETAAAVVALAGLALVTWLVVRQARARPYLAVGWLWYVGMLVPVIGLVQVGRQAHADRYTYLPVIGLLVAAVWLVSDLLARSRAARIAACAACAVALTALSVATARQVARWHDTRTLFTYALTVTRDNAIAHENLGNALLAAGDARAAIPHLEEAARLTPDLPGAFNNLGSALGLAGRYEEAIARFRTALDQKETADGHFNLGFVYARQGRTDDAIRECEAALRLDPRHYSAHAQLGVALADRGRLDEAAAHLRQALEVNPGRIETRRFLAATLERAGRADEAIREYEAILERSPDDPPALLALAWIRATDPEATRRDGAAAVRLAERARDLGAAPGLDRTLAAAYAEAGRYPDAVRACEHAIERATAAGDADEAGRCRAQLSRYRLGQPFHRER